MLGLFFITGLSLALDAMKYQYRLMGIDSTGWAISSYVFLFIKGGLHFGILFLVATGWVFIKPYLTEREKMVLAVVLILQVISNIAYVVYTQVSETSVVWSFWVRENVHLSTNPHRKHSGPSSSLSILFAAPLSLPPSFKPNSSWPRAIPKGKVK